MDILYTVDGHFLPQLATGICAICETNTSSEQITFHIIGQDIPQTDQETIKQFCRKYERTAVFYPVEDLLDTFSQVDTGSWREIIMARLLLAEILPQEAEKVLYLDGDTLAIEPLDKLWSTRMGNAIICGVAEPTIDKRRISALGLTEQDGYINSGVLLIDLKKWRTEHVEEKLIRYCRENADILFASDQDALNVVLKNRIMHIPPVYNFCNTFYIYPYKTIRKMLGDFPYYSQAEYMALIKEPVIVHFLGEDRPWRKGNTHRFSAQYRRFLAKTPYADAPQEEGWCTYYKLWSIFNAAMKPFPSLRLLIINHLIPIFKKIRAKQIKTS